jgi:uncharacterized Fe-S cluster protein YjdI
MDKERKIKYSNNDITVMWKPDICIHAAKCAKGLPKVFDPKAKPWVNMSGDTSESIIAQVNECPSGALSIEKNNNNMEDKESKKSSLTIQVADKGPYLIKTGCTIIDTDGNETVKDGVVALCRCGASSNKPFCDGAHKNTDVL